MVEFEDIRNVLYEKFHEGSYIDIGAVQYPFGIDNHAVLVGFHNNDNGERVGIIGLSANFRDLSNTPGVFSLDSQGRDYSLRERLEMYRGFRERMETLESRGLRESDVVHWKRGIEVRYEHQLHTEEDLDELLANLQSVI